MLEACVAHGNWARRPIFSHHARADGMARARGAQQVTRSLSDRRRDHLAIFTETA
jgi:hypothetical protein